MKISIHKSRPIYLPLPFRPDLFSQCRTPIRSVLFTKFRPFFLWSSCISSEFVHLRNFAPFKSILRLSILNVELSTPFQPNIVENREAEKLKVAGFRPPLNFTLAHPRPPSAARSYTGSHHYNIQGLLQAHTLNGSCLVWAAQSSVRSIQLSLGQKCYRDYGS